MLSTKLTLIAKVARTKRFFLKQAKRDPVYRLENVKASALDERDQSLFLSILFQSQFAILQQRLGKIPGFICVKDGPTK